MRDDVDLVMIQDPASVWVLQMVEAMGFAAPGEGGPMIAAGETSPGGRLPLNTSGGHLSESYMWGWLHIVEIVRQLRGDAGPRQVPNAHVRAARVDDGGSEGQRVRLRERVVTTSIPLPDTSDPVAAPHWEAAPRAGW